MSVRDDLLGQLYATRDQLGRAVDLARSSGVGPEGRDPLEAALASVRAAIDAITDQAFDEGTPGRLGVRHAIQLKPQPDQETQS